LANLRVLFLATRDWCNPAVAGGDINMWECARFLASRGHTVTFLASSFPEARQEDHLDGVRIVRLGGVFSLWLTTFLYYVRKCRGRYDVVVAEGFGGSRIPRLAPLYVREPVLTEWRQVHRQIFAAQYPRVLWPFLNVFERLTAFIHRNTRILAYTPEGKQAFAEIGLKPNNTVVVPVSIRDEWLDYRPTGGVNAPRILWLGKFRRYKSPHHMVLAMPEILRALPEARLILAGRHDDNRYESELRSLVRRLNVAQNVEFLFNLAEDEKIKLLKSCRVLVLPSAVEGFGIVVLEANASGVPVVASTGVPESVVADGSNGLRYPYGNVSSLTQSILRVLQDDALYYHMSVSGLRFAASFSWTSVGRKYEAVLWNLAGHQEGSALDDGHPSAVPRPHISKQR
jgi:glycosyltransferase involved in cell wall biosynthesis